MSEVWAEYERVSSDEQAKRGTSVPEQRGRIHGLADRQGAKIGYSIVDDGITGTTMFRPGIAELTALAQARRIAAIAADDITRLHRCDAEFEIWVKNVLIPNGVRIELVSGSYDTSGDPDAWLAGKIPSILGDLTSRKLSKRLRDANATKAKSGKLVSGRPFGSKRNPLASDLNRPPGYIQRVRDDATYPLLLELFQRRAAGDSFSGIARDFQRRGVPTIDGGEWSATSVRSTVSCHWYIGQIMHKGALVLDSNGEPLQTEHDCMIPLELWRAAQSTRMRADRLERVFLLRRLVVSSHFQFTAPASKAGQPVDYRPRLNKGHYYYARQDGVSSYYSAVAVDAEAGGMPSMLPAGELEAAVVNCIIDKAEGDALLTSAIERGADTPEDSAARLRRQLKTARLEHSKAERALLTAIEEGLTEAATPLNARVRTARELVEELERSLKASQRQSAPPDLAAALEKINRVRECWQAGRRGELAALLHELIERVDVRVDGIKITPRPLCETSIRKGRGSSRRRAGSGRGRSGSASPG